ncbi:MAG: SAVED domain-containing protein [Bacteroidota bacterium]
MSVSGIPGSVKSRLWGLSAGRCQYENCNEPLYYDELTKAEFNTSYIAHIYADSVGGPRYDPVFSPLLKKDLSNLMLLCDRHHRLVDREQVEGHPALRLQNMKKLHEERISMVTAITPNKQSHVVLFGANIGQHQVPLNYREASSAMIPARYPVSQQPIELGIKNLSIPDHSEGYWNLQEKQLVEMFHRNILPLVGNHSVQHFSVFSLAPIPLLIRFGTLLSDLSNVDIYQRHREPVGWLWPNENSELKFLIKKPKVNTGLPVLKISLSAHISDERILSAIDSPCSIWEIEVTDIGNDFLRCKELLAAFRSICRKVYDEIKLVHGQQCLLHVFPAMPVSAAIAFGLTWMPKADMEMLIYDQNKVSNSFVPTIKII